MLMAYNTSQQNNTKMISYFLIYDKTARLPIKREALSKSILLDRAITLVHKLLLFKKSVKITIKRV